MEVGICDNLTIIASIAMGMGIFIGGIYIFTKRWSSKRFKEDLIFFTIALACMVLMGFIGFIWEYKNL